MAAPAQLNLQPVVRGDTWVGVSSINITVDEVPPTDDLSFARIQFRKEVDSNPAGATLDTETGGIVILSASNWQISLPEQKLPLESGQWGWDLETTDSTGRTKTYLAGTLEVIADYSRPRRCL